MIRITQDGFDINTIILQAKTRKIGAMVTFLGTVRDDGMDRLLFEAYEEVAIRELET